MFEFTEHVLDRPALTLRYHLVPWDAPILGQPVAAISAIDVRDDAQARLELAAFQQWIADQRVVLASCRLPQAKLRECSLLESIGFRFIELNYQPRIERLQDQDLAATEGFDIRLADPEDAAAIGEIAGQIFDVGRFHLDPMVGPEIGNRRYRTWALNAFANPKQSVVKCLEAGRIVAFFVVESPAPDHRFWSLTALAPGLGGRGLGRRVWRAMLRWHQQDGVQTVSTSISSHNTPVHNLYVRLGFHFPPPAVTLHWCPLGRIAAPS